MENENQETKIELDDKQFEEACREAGLLESLKSYTAKIGDKRVTEGIKSYEANRNKKDLSDKERIETLEKELEEVKGLQTKKDLETLIKKELKSQNLSEDLIKYIKTDNNDPSEIEKSVTALRDDLLKIEQDKIDLKLKEGDVPLTGDKAGASSLLENYIKNANEGKNTSPFEGKISKSEGD